MKSFTKLFPVFTLALIVSSCSAKNVPVKNNSPNTITNPVPKINKKSGFQIVLSNTKSATTKGKLIAFKKGGIEKSGFNVNIDKAISEAKSYLGTKHKMGGTSKSGIDCSGLVYTVHKNQGAQLPRTGQEQARHGKIIPTFNQLQKGDLVFYTNTYTSKKLVTHVGIYLGNGKFIHASASKGVMISSVNGKYYWGERFLFGTRIKK